MNGISILTCCIALTLMGNSALAQQPSQQAPAQQQRPRTPQVIENNGLKGNLNAHDPVMIRQNDTYYIYHRNEHKNLER